MDVCRSFVCVCVGYVVSFRGVLSRLRHTLVSAVACVSYRVVWCGVVFCLCCAPACVSACVTGCLCACVPARVRARQCEAGVLCSSNGARKPSELLCQFESNVVEAAQSFWKSDGLV